MPNLQEIADLAAQRERHTVATTAGWVMPSNDHELVLHIRPKDWIAIEAVKRGLPVDSRGFAEGPFIYVPPLNTVEDMEIWRHEIRHALEGDWHGRERMHGPIDPPSCLTQRCEKRLEGLHPDLVRVIQRASRDASMPFIVTCGLRTVAEQQRLYDMGKSRTMNSRHLTGHAVDLAAIEAGTLTWNWPAYETLAGAVKRAALAEGVPIIWGGEWTSGFRDGPHFELPRDQYPATEGVV